jgi:flagellin-like protein
MMKKSKKGVSPLIATVLLIAFAVALGAVVMNWGRGYVQDTVDFAGDKSDSEIDCSLDVGLKLVKIGSTKKICYTNITNMTTLLENGATKAISGLRFRLISTNDDVNTTDYNVSFAKAQTRKVIINQTFGENISEVKIIPKIAIGSDNVLCIDNAVTITDIDAC